MDDPTWHSETTADPAASRAPLPPPGWYPDPDGNTRWWDGTQWGGVATPYWQRPPAAPNKIAAVFAHLGPIIGGFVLPLVLYLTIGRDDRFVRHHASEGLNFAITLFGVTMVGMIVAVAVMLGGISTGAEAGAFGGFAVVWLAVMVISLGSWAFAIVGAVRASQGEWWRYPVCIRLVKGAEPPDTPPIAF